MKRVFIAFLLLAGCASFESRLFADGLLVATANGNYPIFTPRLSA